MENKTVYVVEQYLLMWEDDLAVGYTNKLLNKIDFGEEGRGSCSPEGLLPLVEQISSFTGDAPHACL